MKERKDKVYCIDHDREHKVPKGKEKDKVFGLEKLQKKMERERPMPKP
jgi:hypothetical protein